MDGHITNPKEAKSYFSQRLKFTIGPGEVRQSIQNGMKINIIDVRAPEDYEKRHVPGAINLPKEKWYTLKGLQKNQINVLYCYSIVCHLAAKAAVEFADKGYGVMEMEGGFKSWEENNFPVEAKGRDNSNFKGVDETPIWVQPESATRQNP